jgi:uncharacterized protein
MDAAGAGNMNHDNYPDNYIRGILNTVKTIAMVGISPKENRPSYFAFKYLLERGYRMIPVNPGHAGNEILGQKVYARLADIPEPIDMVDVFRAPRFVPAVVDEALAMSPRPQRDLDAAWRAQRRGGCEGRGRRTQGGDEPLSQDRIWAPVVRNRLDWGQFQDFEFQARPLLGKGVQRMSLNRATTAGGSIGGAGRADNKDRGGN